LHTKLLACSMWAVPAYRACAGYAHSGRVRPGHGVAARRRDDAIGRRAVFDPRDDRGERVELSRHRTVGAMRHAGNREAASTYAGERVL